MGPYLLIIIGLPVGMAVVGKGLGALNRAHIRLTGAEVDEYRPGWTRSMRGERQVDRRGGVLDRVMIVSVAVAALCFAVWFFGFAGSSLPGAEDELRLGRAARDRPRGRRLSFVGLRSTSDVNRPARASIPPPYKPGVRPAAAGRRPARRAESPPCT